MTADHWQEKSPPGSDRSTVPAPALLALPVLAHYSPPNRDKIRRSSGSSTHTELLIWACTNSLAVQPCLRWLPVDPLWDCVGPNKPHPVLVCHRWGQAEFVVVHRLQNFAIFA